MAESNVRTEFDTVEKYIKLQPQERQAALTKLWHIIKTSLPEGFQEAIQYGMIGFVVPHSLYPQGYHVKPHDPLPFLGIANQKHFIAFYHLGVYADISLLNWFRESYAALNIGKLDMGKSCVRFKNIEKIPYALLGELCTKMTVNDYIRIYESNKPVKK